MAQQEMSYAQALNEAKQVIIQQSSRIKGDLEKIKGQQQTIVDQAARITETEGRIAELTRERDELRGQLPTNEDLEALSGMMAILSQKRACSSSYAGRTMRIVADAA